MSIKDKVNEIKLRIFEHKYQSLREFGKENHMFYTFLETGVYDKLSNVYYHGIPGDLIFEVLDSSNIHDAVTKGVILATALGDGNIIHATTQLSRTKNDEERRILVEFDGFIYDVLSHEQIEGCLYDTMYCPKYDEVVPATLYKDSQLYRDLDSSLDEVMRPGYKREEARIAAMDFAEDVFSTGNDDLINRFNEHLLKLNFEPISFEKSASSNNCVKTKK